MATHFLPETFDRLCQAQIDRETGLDGTRRVPWVNGETGCVKGRRPASRKFRFRRSGIREALIGGVDVQVGLLFFWDSGRAGGDVLTGIVG